MGQIDDLKGVIGKRKGFAQANKFSITFPEFSNLPSLKDIEFVCESAQLPGRQILTNDYAPSRQIEKRPNGYSNEDVNFIFNLTNDYYVRDVFSKWTNLVVNREEYSVGYKEDYATTIAIHQLDDQNRKIYTVELFDAFPVTMQSIDLANATTDVVQTISITMSYRDFREFKNVVTEPDTILPDPKDVRQDREPSGGPLPNPKDVRQVRRRIPTIIPQLPPNINRTRRLLDIFGII